MKWCTNCGTEMADSDRFCANCGTPAPQQEIQQQAPAQNTVIPEQQPISPAPQQPAYVESQAPAAAPSNDVPNGGLNFLAFVLPLVGLILFLSMKGSTPVKAKSIGKWALISFIISAVLCVLLIGLIILLAVVAMSSEYYYYY